MPGAEITRGWEEDTVRMYQVEVGMLTLHVNGTGKRAEVTPC